MLGYASFRDLRTREVSDLLWVVFGSLGVVMNVYDATTGSSTFIDLASPILVSTVISFALGYLGLFGGADFKAFVVLAVLNPFPTSIFRPILGIVSIIFPLTVFSNSAIAGASFAIIVLARNLHEASRGTRLFQGHESESRWKKFIVLISGLKVRLDAVRGPPFQYPLEIFTDDSSTGRKLVLMPDVEDDEAALETFKTLRERGITDVWVSNTLPFLVFITFGFFSALIFGDFALWILMRVLSP